MKRALVSVTNKEGIVEFAKGLEELGFEVVSTGGTYKKLLEAGVKAIEIDDVTGFLKFLMEELRHFIQKYMVVFYLEEM